MKIVALSDTHTQHNKLDIEKCDILLYAGDFEIRNISDLMEMKRWLLSIDAKHRVVIFGNHDFTDHYATSVLKDLFGENIHYLCNETIILEGIKIFGSSYSPLFNDWAWMKSDDVLTDIWHKIEENTDIVLTHTMPYGILDQVAPRMNSVGSVSLLKKIKQISPKIQIGGHLHESFGKYTDYVTDYFNVSVLDEFYQLANDYTVINYYDYL
ncbi:MAG: metallophosphoesterase family protein [Candidatus Heimdallarchaeota archaeon]